MKILQISHKPIFPPIDGGSIAMYNLNLGLKACGHDIDVLSINTKKQYCDINKVSNDFKKNYSLIEVDTRVKLFPALLNLFSKKSYNVSRFDSHVVKQKLFKLLKEKQYDLILLESLYSSSYIDLMRENSMAKIVLRSHNVEFQIWENLCNNEKNRIKKWYLKLLAKRLKKYELETVEKVDFIASISKVDCDVFRKLGCKTPMKHISFGINFDDEEFCNYKKPEKEELILFHLGSMSWIPHQEAIKWFLEKVWLDLNKIYPNIKLHLAGSNMPQWLFEKNYANVIITNSFVDGKSFMLNKSIMIVPSFSGSGIRIKIAEGMAKGKVIITTTNGAMGIDCTHGTNIFIADTAKEWISIISNCINDENLLNRISENARKFSEINFEYKTVANKLIESIQEKD